MDEIDLLTQAAIWLQAAAYADSWAELADTSGISLTAAQAGHQLAAHFRVLAHRKSACPAQPVTVQPPHC